MEDQIKLILMDLIDRPVKISRDLIDPERVRELAESIREHGLLQPVILRPSNGRYEVVAGDRRYLAHKLLNFKEIKAIIRDLDDRDTVVVRGIENLQRENLTPSEEGKLYTLLIKEGGLSHNQLAKKTGKSLMTIRRYTNFAVLPDEVRRAVDLKQISLLCLETLLEIDDPDAFKYHFEMAAANGVTEKVARLWVNDFFKTKAGNFYSDQGSPPHDNVGIETKPVYMTCESCHAPVEVPKIQHLIVCRDCAQKVRQAKNGKS